MYKAQGQIKEFNELKPKLTHKQQSLLGAFYRLSNERTIENGAPYPIKDKDIRYYQKYNGSCSYASDLFIMAIHAIDNEYIKQQCDEMKHNANKGK